MSLEFLILETKNSFNDPESATDEDALGLLISRYFQWDGVKILYTAASALEDANFHRECGIIRNLAAIAENK